MFPPLTPAQRQYLAAFDAFLTAKSNRQRLAHRHEMGERLNWVLSEAGVALPEETRWVDSWFHRSPSAATVEWFLKREDPR